MSKGMKNKSKAIISSFNLLAPEFDI
jgi:hypothetical protein